MFSRSFSWLRRTPGLFVAYVMTRTLGVVGTRTAPCGPVVYKLCEQGELLEWSSDLELELEPAKVGAAFGRGDSCVGAFLGERLIGYVWYSFGDTPHTADIWVRIPRCARYAYKALIRRGERGRRLGQEMYERAGAICPLRGRSIGITFIYVDNVPSIRAAEKVGWRTAGFAGYLRKGRVFVPFRSPAVRRIDFRFFQQVATSQAILSV